jgi:hypothetical protein
MIQEGGVSTASDRLVATEAEEEIAYATTDLGAWADALDLSRGVDEVDGVVVML